MSFLLRTSMRPKSTLTCLFQSTSSFRSRFVTNNISSYRSMSTTSVDVDLQAVRIEAISKLAEQIGYNEQEHPEVSVTESMIRHLMSNHAVKKKIPKEFVHTLLDASIAMHTALPNIIQVSRLIADTTEVAESSEESVIQYDSRLSILGDLHGQYDDLAMLFDTPELGDYPSPQNQYVFNGDMVDRGPMSVETVVTILYCNLLLPDAVHVLRGNHETYMCNKQFGFIAEVLRKYDADTLHKFHALFNTLPVGAVVEEEYFVVHGGLGVVSGESTIEELNKVDRFGEPKQESIVSELLWSDPLDNVKGHDKNPVRGGQVTAWGPDVTQAFLARNNLQAVIRSHEFELEGFGMCHEGLVWTVFSAPNYEDGGNLGAMIRLQGLNDNLPGLVQYSSAAMKKIADMEKARGKSGSV